MDLLCWLWEKDPGFRDKMPRKLLHVSYLERKTKDWVWSKIKFHVGSREPLLAKVKCWTWSWRLFPQIFKTKQTKSDDPLLLFTVACPDFAVRNSTIFLFPEIRIPDIHVHPCSCQETEIRMVRACQASRQPLQNHPSGHFGGWATP